MVLVYIRASGRASGAIRGKHRTEFTEVTEGQLRGGGADHHRVSTALVGLVSEDFQVYSVRRRYSVPSCWTFV